MSEQAAPPASNGSTLPPNLLTGSKLTDFFMKGQEPGREAQPGSGFTKAPKSISESEAEANEPINAQQAAVQGEDGEEVAPQEAGETGMLDALPEGKGQKDAPFKLTDLPEDRFVEIKVDGQKEVVSLRDLADGHIRRKAFNKFTNVANAAVAEARKYAEAATAERAAVRGRVRELLTNAPMLLEYLLEHQPQVADAFARTYAQVWDGWQKNPDAKRRYEWEREQKKLRAERERLEADKQKYESERTQTEAASREWARLKPIYQRAMREIGFPKITPQFREAVNERCAAARRANGGQLDPEDLHAAIVRANQLFPADAPVQARRPAPVASAPPRPNAQRQNGKNGKDWNSMPYNKRMSDPDFFLRK